MWYWWVHVTWAIQVIFFNLLHCLRISGFASVVTSLYLCLYYNIINAWSFWYLFHSFQVSFLLRIYCMFFISHKICAKCWTYIWTINRHVYVIFTSLLASPALGSVPRQQQLDRAYRRVWTCHAHSVLLLPGNIEHLPFHWWQRRHTYRTGTLPAAGLGDGLPVCCPRSQVNWKG